MNKQIKPSISILLPFYGGISDMQSAVESLLKQDDEDWNLIVIDDASPDTSAGNWLLSINDKRIKYLRNKTNLGISGNFQKCLSSSNTDYVVFIGQDDLLLSNYVSNARYLISHFPNASIIQPGVQTIDDQGHIKVKMADRVKRLIAPSGPFPKELIGEELARSLSRGNWAYFPSLIWHRKTIDEIGFSSDLDVALDLELLFEVIVRQGNMVLDDYPSFQYRRHKNSFSSITSLTGLRFEEEKNVYQKFAVRFADLGWKTAYQASRLRITSRINGFINLPGALFSKSPGVFFSLVKHIFEF